MTEVDTEQDPGTDPVPETRLRYVTTKVLPVEVLVDYPGNPRIHDEVTLDSSVIGNGQIKNLVVRAIGDGAYQILSGHGTRDALVRAAGVSRIRCEVYEGPDDAAWRAVSVLNKASDGARYDEERLMAFLTSGAPATLAGSGWTADEVDKMLAAAEVEAPDAFGSLDDLDTDYRCPSCGYEWSGQRAPATGMTGPAADVPEGFGG